MLINNSFFKFFQQQLATAIGWQLFCWLGFWSS